jgi:hypothetical protein
LKGRVDARISVKADQQSVNFPHLELTQNSHQHQ